MIANTFQVFQANGYSKWQPTVPDHLGQVPLEDMERQHGLTAHPWCEVPLAYEAGFKDPALLSGMNFYVSYDISLSCTDIMFFSKADPANGGSLPHARHLAVHFKAFRRAERGVYSACSQNLWGKLISSSSECLSFEKDGAVLYSQDTKDQVSAAAY